MYYPTFKEEATPMKQTAVEWLIEELGEYFPHEIGGIHLMVNKAKEMEKQQERDACGLALSKLLYKQALKSEISDEEIDNLVVKQYENVGDEKLFPNHTDKDIWMNGFYEGAKWYREQLKSK
jgi:hypothetical protein